MLDTFRKGQRWLSLIFVSVIGLVFVFFLGVGGTFGPSTPTGNTIIQLDDVQLTSRDFAREKSNTETRLRQELGDSYDRLGGEQYVDSQALTTLLNTVLLAAAADEMGLEVTQDELRRVVQANPLFIDAEGRFSPAAFDRFAAYEFGSQRAFIQSFSRSLLGQKLVWLLVGQTTLSDTEIDLQTRYDLEEIGIAYVALDTNLPPNDEALTNEEVAAYADAHGGELESLFEERASDLSEPERVRARHILILVAANASAEDEAKARSRAEAARDRIKAGEDFATIAAELSEDVGSAQKGGDLGLFARGDNDPALDGAAFGLEPGGISDVIRSAYGFHVVSLDEKIAPVPASFEAARLDLARERATSARALERANQRIEALTASIAAGNSLEEAARADGLTLERPPHLKRRSDGFIPGLGAAEEILSTAFTLEAGESSPEVFELPDRRVLIQVLEHKQPDAETIASERLARRDRARIAKQNRVLQSWINDYRRQLEAAGRLKVNVELALAS